MPLSILHGLHRRGRKLWATVLAGIAAFAVADASRAALITFDELALGTTVTDQYAPLGVTIEGGVIATWMGGSAPDPLVSPPHALNDLFGPGLYLSFTGVLPTTVSMFVTTFFEDRAFLQAYDANGLLVDTEQTEGWGGTEENSTPAVPREWVALASPEGIATVRIGALFFRRGDLYIDNLALATAAAALPEPPTAALLAAALLPALGAFFGKRRRRVG